MPEPNLPPLHIHTNTDSTNTQNLVDAIFLKTKVPEMPQETRDQLINKYGVHKALVIVLVVSTNLRNFVIIFNCVLILENI